MLLSPMELECIDIVRKAFNSMKPEEATDKLIDLFSRTHSNREFIEMVKKMRWY